ncbi:MAG: imidazolonepropionase, partial [Algoriphagus sp.]
MKKLIGPIRQVLTLDKLPLKGALQDEQLEIFTQAGILIEGEYIQKIGSWIELKKEFPEAEIHELDGDFV